jgi:transcriptional regulator with XRE-family HTH domain
MHAGNARLPGEINPRQTALLNPLFQRVLCHHAIQVTQHVTDVKWHPALPIKKVGNVQSRRDRKLNRIMTKPTFAKTYIREWREHRGLSLRKLAARIEVRPGEELISFASLGRIERGEQPYSQPILEEVAFALNVTVSMLLERDPGVDGEVIDLMRRIPQAKRDDAIKMLKALAS